MKGNSFSRRVLLLLLFAFYVGGALSFATPVDKMTFPEALKEFDKADDKSQRKLAKRMFDILNEEETFDEPHSILSNWPADSIRAEVWLAASQYYFFQHILQSGAAEKVLLCFQISSDLL